MAQQLARYLVAQPPVCPPLPFLLLHCAALAPAGARSLVWRRTSEQIVQNTRKGRGKKSPANNSWPVVFARQQTNCAVSMAAPPFQLKHLFLLRPSVRPLAFCWRPSKHLRARLPLIARSTRAARWPANKSSLKIKSIIIYLFSSPLYTTAAAGVGLKHALEGNKQRVGLRVGGCKARAGAAGGSEMSQMRRAADQRPRWSSGASAVLCARRSPLKCESAEHKATRWSWAKCDKIFSPRSLVERKFAS